MELGAMYWPVFFFFFSQKSVGYFHYLNLLQKTNRPNENKTNEELCGTGPGNSVGTPPCSGKAGCSRMGCGTGSEPPLRPPSSCLGCRAQVCVRHTPLRSQGAVAFIDRYPFLSIRGSKTDFPKLGVSHLKPLSCFLEHQNML